MPNEPEVITKLTEIMSLISENYDKDFNPLDLECLDLLNELANFYNNNVSSDDLESIKKKILELDKKNFYLWFIENKNTVKNYILDM
jgi:chorismate mutase